jgi:hypothetical protein
MSARRLLGQAVEQQRDRVGVLALKERRERVGAVRIGAGLDGGAHRVDVVCGHGGLELPARGLRFGAPHQRRPAALAPVARDRQLRVAELRRRVVRAHRREACLGLAPGAGEVDPSVHRDHLRSPAVRSRRRSIGMDGTAGLASRWA